MKNDLTTTFLNFVLAVLVICCVTFALWDMKRTHQLRALQYQMQQAQQGMLRAQALANDVVAYNAQAKSPELNQILQSALNPQPQPQQQPAAK
jgi:hypothetical protein